MTNRNFISDSIRAESEMDVLREEANRQCEVVARQARAARAETLEDIRGKGVVVNASMDSVARFSGVSAKHLDFDYHSKRQKLWPTLNRWLDLNCQGDTVVLNIVAAWQVEAGERNANAQDDGSSNAASCGSSADTDTGVYIDVDSLYEMRQSSDPIDVGMASEGISVWFQLPSDAAKFKLAWA